MHGAFPRVHDTSISNMSSPLPLSSFLNLTRNEMDAMSLSYNIAVRFEVLTSEVLPSKYIHAVLGMNEDVEEIRVMAVNLFEDGVLIAHTRLCDDCYTQQTDEDGCMCSPPKGYCFDCYSTKCHTYHNDDVYDIRSRRHRSNKK